MSCFYPLKRFIFGVNASGKTDGIVVPYETHHVEVWSDGHVVPSLSPDRGQNCYKYVTKYDVIPCGQCLGCRYDRAKEWADRLMMELSYHDSAYFATLTYDDNHVPTSYYGDASTGEAKMALSLRKRDLQLFFKRLRKKYGDGIRYYAVGEYGSTTYRPHYHAIIFGLKLDDLEPFGRNELGQDYFVSKSFARCWYAADRYGVKSQIGHICVAPVTWETCAYTARYCTKKLTGDAGKLYNMLNIEPPFSVMSNRPGIARKYYDEHPDMYYYKYINLMTPQGGRKVRPPHYFDKLYDIDNPEHMAQIRAARKEMAETAVRLKLDKTDMSYLDYLDIAQNNFKDNVVNKLGRRL